MPYRAIERKDYFVPATTTHSDTMKMNGNEQFFFILIEKWKEEKMNDWKREENDCQINKKKMHYLKTIILIATEEKKTINI